MFINTNKEPRRNCPSGKIGQNGLLGSSLTWVIGDDSVSDSTWNYRAWNQIFYGDICLKLTVKTSIFSILNCAGVWHLLRIFCRVRFYFEGSSFLTKW